MGVTDRPFVGTWKHNLRGVVKYTPDALVYINGDTSIPGCPSCRGKIDLKAFVTSISVEAGTDPGAHSANISLVLPRIQGEQLFVDGRNKLLPGLEVHIFFKGYFPVKGQFQHLPDPQIEFENPNGNTLDLTDFASFPYYPVFHGVITSSTYDCSDGSYKGSLTCASLLHFWQYQNITSNAAVIAARPHNSPGRTSLFGHNFNNMHPLAVMYTLYKDVAGAAMAVEFALDEQSNMTAVTADGGSQIFDQVASYWEQRFKTRIQSLRMYGVNGQLFNAAQQAFLASASNRDADKLISNDLFSDSETSRSESDPFSANFSVAKSLGLAGGGLDLTFAPFVNQEGEQVSLNLLDMFAFTQDIGEVGSFNVFESTYQTKMEVAQQVTEVTGFEFYQDVDGDLVFKPPFFNMDTSTNRIYRMEDIDIMNFSVTESEPQATYISVRGSWFKGLSGVVPNTGVTGKRGLYIDYKLVAQFGWRPASLDVTYTTDPRVLFFIGVARMDLLNMDVNGANCTIPIRPEMRPGYPIYVPFLDCYYYVKSLSHSFQFGGSCTTSLVLSCRRAKFHAPGEVGEPPQGLSTIDLIKLDRGDLPSRPLVVQQNGSPRMVGFPNVVLALDPSKSNPQFFPVGAGIDHLNSTDDVVNFLNFIREDLSNLQPQVLEVVQSSANSEGVITAAIPGQENRYKLRFGPQDGDIVEFDLQELLEGFSSIDGGRKGIQAIETEIRDKQYDREAAIQRENVFFSASKQTTIELTSADRAKIERELGDLQSRLQTERERLNTSTGGDNKLLQVIQALQKFRGSPSRRKIDGLPQSDVTASYFDSLMNLKSQYMASDLPGRYRYYSCSHPNPEYQGQPIILFDDGEKAPALRNQFVSGEVPPTASPNTTVLEDGLPSDPEERLRAKLELVGANWMDTRAISPQEGIALGLFPEGSSKGSQGILGRPGATSANLDEQTSDNLANVIDVANQIRQALLANPAFVKLGFTIGAGSSWRPDQEDDTSESMHALGRAIDLGLRPGKADSDSPERKEAFRAAFDLFKVEAMRAYQSRRVNFVQIYQDRAGKPDADFIHIDQRTEDDVALVAQKRGLANTPENRAAKLIPGTTGFVLVGDPYGTSAERSAELKRLADASGYPGKGVSRGYGKSPKKLFPLGSKAPSAPPPAVSSSPTPRQSEVPLPQARIEIREVSLDVPRKVIQFIPPKAASDGIKTPEAEVGVGECSRGLNIAQGPGRPPQILTTDQIQTLSFSQFSSTKFVDIVGTSLTTGSVSLNSQSLFVRISDQFAAAAQDVENFDQTPEAVFQETYDQLKEAVEQIEVPNFQGGVRLTSLRVSVAPFETSVPSVAVTPTMELQFPGSTGVTVATTSFRKLSGVPGFTSPSSKYAEGQNLGPTVGRIASAYANSLVRAITKSFDQAKLSASEPAEGKTERLAEVQSAFVKISDASTGTQTPVSVVSANPVQDKTVASSKMERAKHSPVFPISDEKGYEHFGAYRYGRGLTVDAGGTFEFIHSNGDPFQNVSAQSVEEFLRVLTLVKSTPGSTSELDNIRKGQVDALQGQLQGSPIDSAEPPPAIRSKIEVEDQVFGDLSRVAFELKKTAQGQEALDELISSNGDTVGQGAWDVSDTQFARRFSNFSANYAKSPVFKTTVANAAVQLTDLISLLDKTTSSCSCSASMADVFFDGLDSLDFVPVAGSGSLVEWSKRAIAGKTPNYLVELRRIRGENVDGTEISPEILRQVEGIG